MSVCALTYGTQSVTDCRNYIDLPSVHYLQRWESGFNVMQSGLQAEVDDCADPENRGLVQLY